MIRWIIILLGVSTGSSLSEPTKAKPTKAPTKNDTRDAYLPQFDSSSSGFKPKRQLDDFDFDASSYDTSSSVFPIKKINGLTAFDDEDTSDFSGAISAPSYKVPRSNAGNIGTHNENYDSVKYEAKPPLSGENYSNENQPNTGLNGPISATYYKPDTQQPKYVETNNIYFNDRINVPFNSYPEMTEYAFSIPIYSLKPVAIHPLTTNYQQNHPIQSSYQSNQVPIQNIPYRTIFGQGLKTLPPNTNVYAPLHRHNSQQPQQQTFQTHFQNFAQNPYDIQFTTASTADISSKKLPLPIVQLQSGQDGYIQGIETMPVIFSAESGIQYKSEPAFSIPVDYSKSKNSNQRSGSSAPFLSQPTLGPIQVLPLQTASSTTHLPKYKGAAVSQYPQKQFSKIPNDYQEFKTQTQLHFGGQTKNNNKQEALRKPVNAKPLERIRTDVEVIDKKKPIPPLPKNDDDDEGNNDDESGEGYQNKDSYLPKSDDDEVDSRKYFKESELEGDFKPSKSYPFKEYEEKYSKPLKKVSKDDDDEENDDTDVDLAAKFRYLSKADDDDDDDDDSAEDKPRSKYKAYPIEDSYKSYNDDDDDDDDDKEEGESRKQERKEKTFDFEREHPSSRRGKSRKERRKAVDEETEEPIRKKPSKPKNSQYRSKESSEFSKRPRSHANFQRHETPERGSKRNRRRPSRDETGEPLNHPSKSKRNYSPETHFEGPSNVSPFNIFSSTRSPLSAEDSFRLNKGGHDFPLDDGGKSTFSEEEASVTDSYGNPRKSTTTSTPLPHTARSPKTTGDQRTSRKSSGVKTKPILVDSYNKPVSSGLRALVQSKPSYFASDLSRDDILRRLKGI